MTNRPEHISTILPRVLAALPEGRMTDTEQELVGDYEAAAATLKKMVQHVGLNAESVCEDWDTPIGSLGLILAENYCIQRDRQAKFRALWAEYRRLLSENTFTMDKAEREQNDQQLGVVFDQLTQLSQEGQ